MNVLGGIKAGDTIIVRCNHKRLSGDIEMPSIYLADEPQEYGIGINKPYIAKNNHSLVGVYLGNNTNSKIEITDVQLIKGSTPIAYEPYTGGKPSPSPDYPQEITNLNKAELVVAGRNICPDAELLGYVSYSNGIPTNSSKTQPNFPYVQSVESDGIGAVLNTIKGVTYSIAYLGKANTAAVGIAEYKSVDDIGDIGKVVSYVRVGSSKKTSLTASIDGVMVFILASQWVDGTTNLNTFAKEDMIISIGKPQNSYEPYSSKSTVIDLQGNELCSVTENREWSPNTFRDQLVIDSEGNVSLIKRVFSAHIDGLEPMGLGATSTFQYFNYTPKMVRPIDGSFAICSNRFGKIGMEPWSFYVAGRSNAALFFAFPLETFANDGELNEWLKSNPIDVNYLGAEAQTIPLGKVEAPLLRDTVQTIYANTNIPTTMNINYKSYLQEDAMAEKKYLDLAGLTGYDAKIKAAIDAKDATTLQGAKAYADSLGANYDAAGSAATAKTQAVQEAKGYTDGEITKVNAAVAAAKKTADKGVADAAAAKAAADAAKGEVDALEALVGTLPEDAGVATVVAYVDKKTEGMASDTLLHQLQTTVGQHTTDISGLKERMTTAEGNITAVQGEAAANKAAIATLNGTGAGSVKKQVDNAINAFATNVSNDGVVNTFKELVDYCATHGSEAAEMAGNIEKNKSAIAKLETFVGKLPEGTSAANVIAYINEKVAAEQSRAESAESGLSGRITTLEGKFGDGEGSVSSLIEAAKQAAIAAAAADAQNKANTAKAGAVADAKKYTDAEVGKVKTASDAIGARVTAAEGKITALEGKAHTHANAEVLDGITAGKVANWDAAFTAKHTHANAAALDKVTDGKIAAWDTAETNAKAYTDTKIGEFQPISVSEIDELFAQA